MIYEENIKKLLEKCKRNKYKPDLHSFVASIKNGLVYVNYLESFNVTVIKFKNLEEEREHYSLNLPKTIELLEQLEINIESVEM